MCKFISIKKGKSENYLIDGENLNRYIKSKLDLILDSKINLQTHIIGYKDPQIINDKYIMNAIIEGEHLPGITANKSYCYIIKDADNGRVLYVGSDKNGDTRLKQHLIKNDNYNGKLSRTHSKIKEVYDYIKDMESPKIGYSVIEIKQKELTEYIEHLLIEYYKNKNLCEWNDRN